MLEIDCSVNFFSYLKKDKRKLKFEINQLIAALRRILLLHMTDCLFEKINDIN